ncbi:hypothetical protein [Vallitalea sp.]|jgi:hypothetical protein|uniref:hypothetical protein n=1 Tax=Vallitalea sp. TaxID=1882829 RepID=UPI0025D0F7A9|nr:hypothetical protein [Vallitalea sp.]MCT4687632.1 hypothetical protein [Vallitalea sp.]
MRLKKKIFIILLFLNVSVLFYFFVVEDIYIQYDDNPLDLRSGNNLFNNITPFVDNSYNALITERTISTGMYTDANYKNFYVTIKIPSSHLLLKNKDNVHIEFESKLQKTNEWISNNKYIIKMYYYKDDNSDNDPILFYNKKWVGLDKIVSTKQLIPKEAHGNSIYIQYASDLGSFLFMKNGNDIRFFHNYLSIIS